MVDGVIGATESETDKTIPDGEAVMAAIVEAAEILIVGRWVLPVGLTMAGLVGVGVGGREVAVFVVS